MKSIYLLEHTVATKEVLGRIIWQGETFPLGRGKGIFSQRKCDGLSHFFYSVQQSTTCQRLADAKLSKLLVEELTVCWLGPFCSYYCGFVFSDL